jgi:hypothetical protein
MCCSPTLSASSPGRSEKGAKRPREDRCTNAASLQQPSAAYYPVSTSSQRAGRCRVVTRHRNRLRGRACDRGEDLRPRRARVGTRPPRPVRQHPPTTLHVRLVAAELSPQALGGCRCLDPEKLDSGDHGAVLERLDVHGGAERRVMGPTCCEPGLRRRGPAWCRLSHGGPDLVNDLPAVQSPSDRTVKKLTDQVRMTVVPGIFLDHVDIDPSQ